jgi:hypothetical protein
LAQVSVAQVSVAQVSVVQVSVTQVSVAQVSVVPVKDFQEHLQRLLLLRQLQQVPLLQILAFQLDLN